MNNPKILCRIVFLSNSGGNSEIIGYLSLEGINNSDFILIEAPYFNKLTWILKENIISIEKLEGGELLYPVKNEVLILTL
ncbi:MAG: hypothetical protein ACTSRP_05275 [Candidatus Helarchaeota archaeon]